MINKQNLRIFHITNTFAISLLLISYDFAWLLGQNLISILLSICHKQALIQRGSDGSGRLPKTPDHQTKFVGFQFSHFFILCYALLYKRALGGTIRVPNQAKKSMNYKDWAWRLRSTEGRMDRLTGLRGHIIKFSP